MDSDNVTSGVVLYNFEVHTLVIKDATLTLTEDNPIKPMMTDFVVHVGGSTSQIQHNTTFIPPEPGIYRYERFICVCIFACFVAKT